MGWGEKRATLVAQDNDPQRIERLARMRWHAEHVYAHEWLVCADARDIHLLPTVGAAWMPRGRQAEVVMPGQKEKNDWAGALTLATGTILLSLQSLRSTPLSSALRLTNTTREQHECTNLMPSDLDGATPAGHVLYTSWQTPSEQS
jgi:hypothetical protein